MNILMSQKIGVDQHGATIDILESNYINYFSSFNFKIFPISNFSSDLSYFFDLKIKGIILTGGNDITEPNDYIQYRNRQEKRLLQFAINKKIPLFAICRGMQLIHHSFGGKLKRINNHVAHLHILQGQGKVAVNSYHKFAIDEETLSSDFKVFARSVDGVIEGVVHKSLPLLAVQWHPERNKVLKQNMKFNRELVTNFFCRKRI